MSTDDQSRRPERLLGGDDVHERAARIEAGRRLRAELEALATADEEDSKP